MKAQIKKNLYNLITKKNGKPDLLAIQIYKDLKKEVSRSKDKTLLADYLYYVKKYNCSRDTIRKRFVLLEELGFIKRDFITLYYKKGITINNLLSISLIVEGRKA